MRVFGIAALVLLCGVQSGVAQDGIASLTGTVTLFTGARLPEVQAELRGLRAKSGVFRSTGDADGVFHFYGLTAGEYELKLSRDGFTTMNVRSIRLSERDRRTLPPVQMAIDFCGDRHAVLEYVQTLPLGDVTGSLIGSVRLDQRPLLAEGPPMAAAAVELLCGRWVCAETTTETTGEFMFWSVPPGNYKIRVTVAGFYPQEQGGFTAQEGLESIYRPLFLERCAAGGCEAPRPKRVLGLCE